MFYKLKLYILTNKFLRKLYRSMKKKKTEDGKIVDIRYDIIKKYTKGKSFIDIGCMWGVNGYFSFLAEKLGAKEVTAFDIFEPSEKFNKTHSEINSRVIFKQGDINSAKIINELGKFDVVYCTGLLYHVPDPLTTLNRLRQICLKTLIIGTAIIPEMRGMKNMAVYYPFLDADQRKIWNVNEGEQMGITTAYHPNHGYGNWIWGFSNSCLESMLKTSGFNILERLGGRFYSYLVCELNEESFIPVSGEWSEPEYRENIKNYKF